LLILGNARSGSTILGAVLDAHPNMVVANEKLESFHPWYGLFDGRFGKCCHALATLAFGRFQR
jgi:hypothetical protein